MGDISVKSETVSDIYGERVISLVPSSSGNAVYRVDITLGTCDCPAWKFQKKALPDRLPCKHLIALGYVPSVRRVDQEIFKACAPKALSDGHNAPGVNFTAAPAAPKAPLIVPENLYDAF